MSGGATPYRPQSWRQFWESGFETELYGWEGSAHRETEGHLKEASAWHPNRPAVVCFLLDLDSEQRYRITVFGDSETVKYGPQGFNFSAVSPGTSLTIEIHPNDSGTFRILAAQLA